MKKKNVLAAALIASAIVSSATAEEASFWGFNSWHAGKASAICIAKHPDKFNGNHFGCKVEIRPGGGYQTPERWYTLGSGTSDTDPKLWYQDTDGTWKKLSDDDGGGKNFSAVIHVPQRFTNEAASQEIVLMAGYEEENINDSYWFGVDQYETADPQLTGVPYLEVAPDGTLTIVDK